ncbi:hypothetical protein RF55_15074 [Lasius niger]|uniref:Uncharacterized protein n=1 Tax=Lasius niger TaxID=67767 RepID=A0A0J7K6I8_LASNI|nr:hypothetical protein RF55_15074 [Lasius niger]
MEKLIASQQKLHGRIARSGENLCKAGAAKLCAALAQSALKILDRKWAKQFEDQHERLQSEYGDRLEKNPYMKDDFVSVMETEYLQQRAELLEIEQGLAKVLVGRNVKPMQAEPSSSRSVLPRIQLPQFSGKFEDWPAFRDLFRSIVVDKTALSKVEKMHYLKTSVKGDVDQLIRNLPSTQENFERAWATLTEHFENKRLLVRSYLSAFTSLPKMKSDSAADLWGIFHGVVSTVGALEGIGRPITDGSDLFVHLVIKLLDAKTRREWKNSLGKSSLPPSYEALRGFLQEQLMTQEVSTQGCLR